MYIDVSLVYEPGMVVYPGDPSFESREIMEIATGDVCNLSVISFGSHTGTHIDAPRHFFAEGLSVDQIPADFFIGKARVCEIPDIDIIGAAELTKLGIQKGEIILLKTRNSKLLAQKVFTPDYAYLTPEAARYLVQTGIRILGFDYYSIEKLTGQNFEVHRILLGNNIIIVEGLALSLVKPGIYNMIGLPMKIKNGNGSPIRVLLET